jgi:hypothetical protein
LYAIFKNQNWKVEDHENSMKKDEPREEYNEQEKRSDNNMGEFLRSLNSYIEQHINTTQNLIPS